MIDLVVYTGGILFFSAALIMNGIMTRKKNLRRFDGLVNARDSYKTGYHLKRDEAYGWKRYAESLEFHLWSVQKARNTMPPLTETRRRLRTAHGAPHSSVPERETS